MEQEIITILAMMNNMVGGSALIFPVLFLQSGLITSLVITLLSTVYSYYSCYISYIHIGKSQKTIKQSIQRHQHGRFSVYDILCFVSDQLVFYFYFSLISKQWCGILYKFPNLHTYIPYLVWISLLFWNITMKKMKFGVKAMGYGIISIFIYILFILWLFLTRNSQINNQQRRYFLLFNIDIGPILATTASALSIQTIFVSLLKQSKIVDIRTQLKILLIAYIGGAAIYMYVGVFGGIGILNRNPMESNAESILQYFYVQHWQALVLYIIYLIHFYSVWPEWGIINKDRLLNILKIKNKNQKYTIVYFIINHTIGLLIYLYKVNIITLLEIKGGICLFFIVYAIPIYIHVKCKYFSYHIKKLDNQISSQNVLKYNQIPSDQTIQQQQKQSCFQIQKYTRKQKIIQLSFVASMIIFGVYILLWTTYQKIIIYFINIK